MDGMRLIGLTEKVKILREILALGFVTRDDRERITKELEETEERLQQIK